MGLSIGEWRGAFTPELLSEVAELWNVNARGRHAFYPWTAESLGDLLVQEGKPVGRMLTARIGDRLAGFCHVAVVEEDGYPRAGVVEALLVDRDCRRGGIGAALLKGAIALLDGHRPPLRIVDALGAWPFGYVYNTLADGSERSGVFLDEPELYRLFRRAGFEPVRNSMVMRAKADNSGARPRPLPGASRLHVAPRRERTWLDRVFRGRELWDHHLVAGDGEVLSRSIFGLMEKESRHEGKAVFSLFGVSTPSDLQGRGYAGINLSRLLSGIAGMGGEEVELHVYADNLPAVALYKGLGFVRVAETFMMHLRL